MIDTAEELDIGLYELNFEAIITYKGVEITKCEKASLDMTLEVRPGKVKNFEPILKVEDSKVLKIDTPQSSKSVFTF